MNGVGLRCESHHTVFGRCQLGDGHTERYHMGRNGASWELVGASHAPSSNLEGLARRESGLGPEQGKKLDDGKPALDLIDPWFLEDVGHVLAAGARKYDLNQWQRGMAIGKAMAGVLRHCLAILRGEYLDPETKRPHAAHATCGLMFVHYFIRNGMTSIPDDRFGVQR